MCCSHLSKQQTLMPSVLRLAERALQQRDRRPCGAVQVGGAPGAARSPLRIVIYLWLTWRMPTLKRPTVPWEGLRHQFGSQLADTKRGRQQFRRDFQLREVLVHYPKA